MKRLTTLTVIAMVTLATSTGCRTCGSFFDNFNRGALYSGGSCNACDGGTYGGAMGYGGYGYDQGMVYEGDMLLPAPTEVTHGPVTTQQ